MLWIGCVSFLLGVSFMFFGMISEFVDYLARLTFSKFFYSEGTQANIFSLWWSVLWVVALFKYLSGVIAYVLLFAPFLALVKEYMVAILSLLVVSFGSYPFFYGLASYIVGAGLSLLVVYVLQNVANKYLKLN